MEKIYDSVFDAMLIELVNADKITNVVVDKTKSNSIINNVIRLANENNISYDTIIQHCSEAFFMDPTSYKVVETIILLGIDDSGDVTRYAQEYGYYEKVFEQRQENILKQYSKKYIKMRDDASLAISNNKELSTVLSEITFLAEKGMDIESRLGYFLKLAVESRLTFPITEDDKKTIISLLKSFDKEFNTSFFNEYSEAIAKCEIDNNDYNMVAEIVSNICKMDRYKDIYNTTYGEKSDDYVFHKNEFYEYADVPAEANVFFLYGHYDSPTKRPDKAMVITDKGLFITYTGKSDSFFYQKSWKQFANDKLSYDYSFKLNGKNTYIHEKKLYNLLTEIQSELILYFNKHMNGTLTKDETEPEKAKQEIKFIKNTYKNSNNEIDAFKTILERGISSKSGLEALYEREKLLIDKYNDQLFISQKNPKRILPKIIVYSILIIIWVIFWNKLHWIVNIICGWIALSFVTDIILTITKNKEKRAEAFAAMNYTILFEKNFEIHDGHIKLK